MEFAIIRDAKPSAYQGPFKSADGTKKIASSLRGKYLPNFYSFDPPLAVGARYTRFHFVEAERRYFDFCPVRIPRPRFASFCSSRPLESPVLCLRILGFSFRSGLPEGIRPALDSSRCTRTVEVRERERERRAEGKREGARTVCGTKRKK